MTDHVLRAANLAAHAGEHVLLRGIDVDIAAGQVLAVLGVSGSGKTTLGLALHGESQDGIELTGSVALGGRELLGGDDAHRRALRAGRLGHLPQHPSSVLNPVRRIGAVLTELAALAHRTRAARQRTVTGTLEQLDLPADRGFLRRFPHQLSGGQQQRLALAQTLITGPDLLVLDEPTTGLDPATKSDTVEVLRALVAGGLALVLLTHDLPLARQLADDVLVLRDGEVVEHGPGTRPLHSPHHPHTRELLDAEPSPAIDTASPQRRAAESGLLVRGLTHRAGDGSALLTDIDLALPRNTRLGIVGKSGSGKTTLARCIAGLARPRAGTITLDGAPLPPLARRRTRTQRANIQYVPQDPRASFPRHRAVLDHLVRGAQLLRGAPETRARDEALGLLDSLGIDAAQAARRPQQLSGGQLQRAALARALLAHPQVLVCDELTSALDVVSQAELLAVLDDELAARATSLILISHDLAVAASAVDEIYVLDGGRRVECTSVENLFTSPESPLSRDLADAARRGWRQLS